MHHIKAVLRRAVAERRMKGSEKDRDYAIERFLGELGELFTPTLLGQLEDELLAGMFEDWLRSLEHLDFTQRQQALVRDTRLSKVPFLIYRTGKDKLPYPTQSDNVVSLHIR
ncbi:hypothetical protein KZO25_15240 [Halomonas sp. ANAO-440]|uniref:hypothetical protein n=1 Tax=Halomonas sp. ANAO-440 TaxID=2861360 RepID=UPI001CAA4DF1|nr:hypothetical protein [Halomonas sp. ANAO-440]MBZ0331670.1 hypothetical protein [Halomonas sp. ANAO-440]